MIETIAISNQKYNNLDLNLAAPLVCLPNRRPTANDAASRASLKNHGISQDGEVKQKPDSSETRIIRYQRQSIVRRLLPKKRISKCLRWRISKTVKVLQSSEHKKCHFADLVICGRVWDCPVCAAKISERRRQELTKAISQHNDNGGSVILVTLTFPHQREDVLLELLDKQRKASIWFYAHRTYKELKSRYMKIGRVRALEVNHGEANGWHPHVHELWFLQLHLHDYEILKAEILDLWIKACERFGLGRPSKEHGVDVRGGDFAAQYVSKFGTEGKKPRNWGVQDEMTKAHTKKGRNGSRSPFQLLDDYIDGDKRSGALFVEYSTSFHGKRQLSWSKGLKSMFDLSEKTDDDLAHEQEDKAILLAELEPEQWTAITRMSTPRLDNRVIVLTLAENGGVDIMNKFITDLVSRYKQSH